MIFECLQLFFQLWHSAAFTTEQQHQLQLALFHLLSLLHFQRSSNPSSPSPSPSSFLSDNLRTPSGPSLCWQSSRLTTNVFTGWWCPGGIPLLLFLCWHASLGSDTQEGEMVARSTLALKEIVGKAFC